MPGLFSSFSVLDKFVLEFLKKNPNFANVKDAVKEVVKEMNERYANEFVGATPEPADQKELGGSVACTHANVGVHECCLPAKIKRLPA